MATVTRQVKTNLEPGFFERLGDRFSSFVEGCVNVIARIMGGSSNERRIKTLGYFRPKNAEAHTVIPGSVLAKVNALEPKMQALSDDELKGLYAAVPRAAREGRDARRAAARGVRRLPRGRPPHQGHAALRRADRRRRHPPRLRPATGHRRDGDRRRQDARRHARRRT